jgi:hypothetical protein
MDLLMTAATGLVGRARLTDEHAADGASRTRGMTSRGYQTGTSGTRAADADERQFDKSPVNKGDSPPHEFRKARTPGSDGVAKLDT